MWFLVKKSYSFIITFFQFNFFGGFYKYFVYTCTFWQMLKVGFHRRSTAQCVFTQKNHLCTSTSCLWPTNEFNTRMGPAACLISHPDNRLASFINSFVCVSFGTWVMTHRHRPSMSNVLPPPSLPGVLGVFVQSILHLVCKYLWPWRRHTALIPRLAIIPGILRSCPMEAAAAAAAAAAARSVRFS